MKKLTIAISAVAALLSGSTMASTYTTANTSAEANVTLNASDTIVAKAITSEQSLTLPVAARTKLVGFGIENQSVTAKNVALAPADGYRGITGAPVLKSEDGSTTIATTFPEGGAPGWDYERVDGVYYYKISNLRAGATTPELPLANGSELSANPGVYKIVMDGYTFTD